MRLSFYTGLIAYALTATQAVQLDFDLEDKLDMIAAQVVSEASGVDKTIASMMKPSKEEKIPTAKQRAVARNKSRSKSRSSKSKRDSSSKSSGSDRDGSKDRGRKPAPKVPQMDPQKIKSIIDAEVNKKVASIKKDMDAKMKESQKKQEIKKTETKEKEEAQKKKVKDQAVEAKHKAKKAVEKKEQEKQGGCLPPPLPPIVVHANPGWPGVGAGGQAAIIPQPALLPGTPLPTGAPAGFPAPPTPAATPGLTATPAVAAQVAAAPVEPAAATNAAQVTKEMWNDPQANRQSLINGILAQAATSSGQPVSDFI